MKFRTEVSIPPSPVNLGYEHPILSMGSCFSENIGHRLQYHKFNIVINPFGIVYNPASLASLLDHLVEGKIYTEEDLLQHQEVWHSFDFHSRYSHLDPDEALQQMNESRNRGTDQLQQASIIFLTVGTSWAYWLKDTEEVVNNCHQLPADRFDRKMLSIHEMVDRLEMVIEKIEAVKPNLQYVWSVSPVRHLKDGMAENNWSKARLLEVCHTLVEMKENHHYFPGYEIMMDDLRDYRFYGEAMVHPTAQAIDYIWELFLPTYFTNKTRETSLQVARIQRNLAHRPRFKHSKAHQQMLRKTLDEMAVLEQEIPLLNFDKERDWVLSHIER